MTTELLTVRLKAFALQALGLIVSALLGVLVSADFSALVTANFGETVLGSIILLAISGLVNHLRNLMVINNIGARGDRPQLF